MTPLLLFVLLSATEAVSTAERDVALVDAGRAPSDSGADELGEESAEAQEAEEPEIDPCVSLGVPGKKWIDRMNRGLHRAVCESALWFDNLFGDSRVREDRQSTYGRLLLGVHLDEREGLGDFTNFEAQVSFPKLERRLNAFIGRGDRERVITGQTQVDQYVPPAGLEDQDDWLIGLGYSPARGRRSKFSFDVGADLGFPMNPFVRARYRHRFFPGDRTLVRVRPSLFWEREEGAGTATRVDVDHLIGRELLFRWRNIGTWTEESEGVEWYLELTLFQNLGVERALAYQVGSFGDSDAAVPVREQFARLIFRQQFARDWLFLDVRPGVSFRREELHESRELVPFLSVGVEMVFGNRPVPRAP